MNYSIEGLGLKLNTREDIAPYIEQIEPNITQLEEIHLCGNTIGVGAAQALAEVLKKASEIRVADFADIFTGRLITEIPTALSALCDSLIDKEHLVEVNLSDNAFGGRAIPAEKRSSLRIVICGRNRLEDGSASAWAEAFAAHGTLVEVRLPQNGIRMAGSVALAEGLAKNADLELLDLQDNTLSQRGDQAFANALSSWPRLHTLNFSDCVLSEEGEVPQVIEALANGSNPLLRTLQLQNDNLENSTVAVLARGIGAHLKAVTRIEFQENDAEEDDPGIETLKENLIVRGGKFLEELLDAEEGDVSTEFADALEKEDDVDEESDQLADLLDNVSLQPS
ncbi:hypothetical protein BC827DRAFT_1162571 [Russula dissimulans]|nr:hypothetical protein BC827DRAFT_1162571 [Russula dissimulans]